MNIRRIGTRQFGTRQFGTRQFGCYTPNPSNPNDMPPNPDPKTLMALFIGTLGCGDIVHVQGSPLEFRSSTFVRLPPLESLDTHVVFE